MYTWYGSRPNVKNYMPLIALVSFFKIIQRDNLAQQLFNSSLYTSTTASQGRNICVEIKETHVI